MNFYTLVVREQRYGFAIRSYQKMKVWAKIGPRLILPPEEEEFSEPSPLAAWAHSRGPTGHMNIRIIMRYIDFTVLYGIVFYGIV